MMETRMPRPTDNTEALNAFIARKAEIDAMLERLAALSADHFDVSPDDVHWGHVGTLAHYAELLKRITDSAFKEGEHAA
jgi:hypothetical protein